MSGVTDALIEGAEGAADGNTKTHQTIYSNLREKHYLVAEKLLSSVERTEILEEIDHHLNDFKLFCNSVEVLGEVTPRAMDVITSLGERLITKILAAVLREAGKSAAAVDTTDLIITDNTFQNAVPKMNQTCQLIQKRLPAMYKKGIIPVVTGFIGGTEEGVTTTLGRGGSDYSAAILADCLKADELWIWTDVDGVMTSDPRLVPNAQVLPTLSYQELSELAYFGAKVVHPRTIRPVIAGNIPLFVKNTFNPDFTGTRIVPEAEQIPSTVKAISAIKDLSLINVEGRGMLGVPGIAARTFAAVASQGASVLMITQASSEQSIAFVIKTAQVESVIKAIEGEMALELSRKDIDKIWSLDDVVIVTAVGKGLRTTPGVGARVFSALAEAEVNVIAVAQGSSESSLSLVVAEEDAGAAVRMIHDEVILNP
jgi:aspartate kinase